MKKFICAAAFMLVAVLALCACSGSKTAGSTGVTYEGTWNSKSLPESIAKNYDSATIEIMDGKFTYTLFGKESNSVIEGSYKSTGKDSAAMYAEVQKNVDPSSNKVTAERKVEASASQESVVYVKVNSDGSMTATGGTMQIQFTKAK